MKNPSKRQTELFARRPDAEAAPRRSLIIDDDPFQRKLISRVLVSQFDFQVTEAADGQQALQAIDQATDTFDLILCDLDMPVMDGLAFVRYLSEVAPGVPLAIVSGVETALVSSVLSMCRAYGVHAVGALSKPLKPEEFSDLLAHLDQSLNTQLMTASAATPQFALNDIIDASERHEFEAYFQAKACMKTGRIVGAEALARWRHPTFGVLPPHPYFIAQLENSGNIAGITDVVLRKATMACRTWLDRGHALTVSVNLSQRQLQDDLMLADRISEIVSEAGLEPAQLILEITETVAATDIGPILENLARLKMRGFGLSIDDFGTGYSSLEQLSRVAFSELKIDRGFVADMLARAESHTIIASSIDMASKLGIRTVAEGVETQAEWDMLCALGCDQVQGYFLGQPQAADAFLEHISEHNR